MREELRGEHLDVACPLALATVLADLDLVASLVHAEQAPAGCAVVGILGRDQAETTWTLPSFTIWRM